MKNRAWTRLLRRRPVPRTWTETGTEVQALRDYPGRPASTRGVVVGMVSNGLSIAVAGDPGMLDVVGFDTATPQLISDLARGALS